MPRKRHPLISPGSEAIVASTAMVPWEALAGFILIQTVVL